ncbi:MAG: DNA-binding protein [Methanomicrobiales archaeon]|jgi:programmed cell death protein 5|nr:DNA-binding protein [Methanomicrobiales archaeon]
MGEEELTELRRRRIAQMQQQAVDQQMMQEDAERQRQTDAQIHAVLMQILEPEARERLNAIRLTRPDFARSVETQLVTLAQQGRLKQRLSDEQLKSVLSQLTPKKRDFTIRRKG